MTTDQLIVVAGAIFLASIVYMVAGFGFSLLAMPLMTIAVPVEDALVISSLLAILSTWWQALSLRHDADRPIALRMGAAAYVGMPLGLVVLNVVDDRSLKIVLGSTVLLATALLARQVSFARLGGGFDYAMGFVSGVLNTSLGTNGPPLVFGLQTRGLPPERFRATIAVVFAMSNVFAMTLFALDGKITADGLRAALITVPVWLAGLWLGLRIRPLIPAARFRRLVLALLAVTGVTAIAFALT